MAGPFPYPESPYSGSAPQQPFPGGQVPSAYPGMLPPPVNYRKSPRRKWFAIAAVGVVVIALVAAVVIALATRSGPGGSDVTVSDASATTAIQGYLDAMSKGDDETIARNNSCGFFDAVNDKRSDMTLANLTSDAFRRQFGSARVSSIDKIVTWSPTQAQVLFTMRATPAGRSQGEVERQAIAQLLIQDRKILVCSYLPRGAGQF